MNGPLTFTRKQGSHMKSTSTNSIQIKAASWLATICLAWCGVAFAQTDENTDQSEQADDGEVLEEIVVVASGYRESLLSALQTKQNSSQIVDAITAEEMGRFPAANLAEAMQGVTGVSMTRDDGAGEFISIRGMAPEMTRIELNGRSVSLTAGSANPENATTLSFFSPDMINRVTVIKTPRAIDVEGGVGGTVKLETLRPLDVGKFMGRVYGNYGDNEVKKDPTTTLGAFFNTIFADGRAGLAFGGTYTDNDRRTDQVESLDGWSPVDDDDPSLGVFAERVRVQQRVGEQPRTNVNGTFQFQVNDNFEFWTEFVYAQEDRNELQQRLESEYDRGTFQGGTVNSAGTLIQGDFTGTRVTTNYLDRLRDIEQYGYTFGGEWGKDDWTVTGKASYSESEEDTIEARARIRVNRMDTSYDLTNPDFIAITNFPGSTDLTDFLGLVDGDPGFNRLDWNLRNIGTEETAFSIDAERDLDTGIFSAIYFGTRFASRDVARRQGQVADDDISGFTEPGFFPSLVENEFFFDEGVPPLITDWHRPDTGAMHQNDGEVRSLVVFDPEDTWSLTEDTTAIYVMTDFGNDSASKPYSGNVGVRYVDYDYSGQGFQTDPDDTGGFIPFAPKESSSEVLPSLNVRWAMDSDDSDIYLRFGAGRVLSRPNPQDIKPTAELNDDLDEVDVGNPALDPYLAWQYDLAVEKYFGETGEGLFSFGIFYKDVENFFESVSLENQDLTPFGVPDTGTINTAVNGGTASVTGFETSFQTPFLFLDGIGRNFGIVMNYTYVDSERTTQDGTKSPMPGTSEHSANAVFYFANEKVDSRLILNFRDDYLVNQDDQEYVEGATRLDFAFRYNFTEDLVFSLDVANITEETEFGYYDGMISRYHKRQLEGRRVIAGLSYTF
jgi:iron complex outermembrane receptor protein